MNPDDALFYLRSQYVAEQNKLNINKMKNVIIDGVEYAPVQVKDWEIVSIAPLQNNKPVAVRRLSDNEIFSTGENTDKGIIKGFYVNNDKFDCDFGKMMVHFVEVRANRCLNEITKVPTKKKDWEIVSFKSKHSGAVYYNIPDTYDSYDVWVESWLTHRAHSVKIGTATIHSIKRLSDGEVFTVGDSVDYKPTRINYTTTINSFEIHNGVLHIKVDYVGNLVFLDEIKKCVKKRHVLTTFDGQKIYEGDKFWPVYQYSTGEMKLGFPLEGTYYLNYIGKYNAFSTEQAAKDFIVENKPGTLSLKDVMGAMYNPLYNGASAIQNHESVRALRKKIRKDLNF